MKILLVEDETFVSLLIEEMIAELGHSVIGPAVSVDAAMPLIETCDLAILDINLSGERVFPVADVLMERGVPFMFSSGHEEVEERMLHIPKLVKPFNAEMLEEALVNIIP